MLKLVPRVQSAPQTAHAEAGIPEHSGLRSGMRAYDSLIASSKHFLETVLTIRLQCSNLCDAELETSTLRAIMHPRDYFDRDLLRRISETSPDRYARLNIPGFSSRPPEFLRGIISREIANGRGLLADTLMSLGVTLSDHELAAILTEANSAAHNSFVDVQDQWLRPELSANSLLDYTRTKAYVRAINASVSDLLKRNPGEPVLVCDAGCGAMPILGITAALCDPSRVFVTCVEANPVSAALAGKVVSKLGLSNVTVARSDISTFESREKFDLVVTDTMMSGLVNEPQVMVSNALAKLRKEGGVSIPGDIRVSMGIIPVEAKEQAQTFVLRKAGFIPVVGPFPLAHAMYHFGDENFKQIHLSGTAPPKLPPGAYECVLYSTVRYPSINFDLKIYDSEITIPITIGTFAKSANEAVAIDVAYRPDEYYRNIKPSIARV